MALSTLVNTAGVFNDTLVKPTTGDDVFFNGYYPLYNSTNANREIEGVIETNSSRWELWDYDDGEYVYNSNSGWYVNQQIVFFESGSILTDSNFIAWVEANATQSFIDRTSGVSIIRTRNTDNTSNENTFLNDSRLTLGTSTPSGGLAGDIYLKQVPETITTTKTTNNGTCDTDGKYFVDSCGLTICYKVISGNFTPAGTWGGSGKPETKDNFIANTELFWPVTYSEYPGFYTFFNSPWCWQFSAAGYNAGTNNALQQGIITMATSQSGGGSRSYRAEIIGIGKV